jgi:hypothetical protein
MLFILGFVIGIVAGAVAAVVAGASVPEEDEPEEFAVRFRPEEDSHEDV